MYALFKNGNVLPWQEVDVAEIHDGDILIMSYDKEYLEKQGEWFKALDIAQQYKPFLCPFCSIINENTFGWLERMMSRARNNDHTPVKRDTHGNRLLPYAEWVNDEYYADDDQLMQELIALGAIALPLMVGDYGDLRDIYIDALGYTDTRRNINIALEIICGPDGIPL